MEKYKFYDDPIIQKAYTAKKLLDLAFLIQAQVTEVYESRGMIFPVSCSSTLLFLNKRGPASVTEVARALQHPHQTVAQHLTTLSKLNIIEKRADQTDRRRVEYVVTDLGAAQANFLDDYNHAAAQVFEQLDQDIGTDLGSVLDTSIAALKRQSMGDRFLDQIETETTPS